VHLARLSSALLAGLAVVVAGCGGEQRDEVTFRGEQADVAALVSDLQDAAEQEEVTRICRALVAEPLAGSDCAERVQQAIDDSDQYQLDVRAVRVSGDTATARVIVGSGDAERTATMRFVRQGGTWRISAFA
jgi:hypothetical protein